MKKVLVIGGCGFIGSNVAAYHLKQGDEVTVVDNLSRNGTAANLEFLRSNEKLDFINIEVRDSLKVLKLFEDHRFDLVYHLAAQVAVTTSVVNPREDLEINLLGTFNVLEAMRLTHSKAILIYTSTNKVYGELNRFNVVLKNNRYAYQSIDGVNEECQLDFHSPYGCSKGAADQYVIDYSRIYGLKTIVFRQSCIYGYRQFGVEDQGWVAWFIIASLFGKDLTIYGDGKQVRDVLFIDDLIDAYVKAADHIAVTNGQAYNIGGGKFDLSLLELIGHLEKMMGRQIKLKFADWRPGDQKVFICDIGKAKKDFGWEPKVTPEAGVKRLYEWCRDNKELFKKAGII
ncbi:MAG: dTDP-glucose 4,6 dehydratase [Methanocella sp. PtaU1.Bin125]|nr:MAG: dTDP-glucose 4,6 dehydratase [Methanocella sp. PtaU1.Bin125]